VTFCSESIFVSSA